MIKLKFRIYLDVEGIVANLNNELWINESDLWTLKITLLCEVIRVLIGLHTLNLFVNDCQWELSLRKRENF